MQSLLSVLPRQSPDMYVGPDRLDPNGTIGESPLIAGSVISGGQPGPVRPRIPADAVGVLRVLAGPDTGRWCWVRSNGPTTVARDPGATLPLKSDDVSRKHAVLTVDVANGVKAYVEDVGSTNGTYIGRAQVTEKTAIPVGGVVEIGDDVVQWTPLQRVDQEWRKTADGRIEFNRRFHQAPSYAPATVQLPTPVPEQTRNLVTMIVGMLVPLVAAVAMAVLTRQMMYLLMAFASPIVVLVQHVVERRRRKRMESEYAEKKTAAAAEIANAITAEERVRRFNDPDELTLTLYASGGLTGLWTKQLGGHDALTVRVGVQDLPASVVLQGERWKGLPARPQQRAVPVTVDLRQIGVLGVVGDEAARWGLLRWIVLQLATRRSPDDLLLYVLSKGDGSELRWARWLPHLDVGDSADAPCRLGVTDRSRAALIDELKQIVEAREAALQAERAAVFDSDVVVVIDGARALRNNPKLGAVLRKGPAVGVYALCIDDADINECKGTVTLLANGTARVLRSQSSEPETVTAESTTPEHAERLARLLAPLRDRAQHIGGEGTIPYPVRFLDLLDINTPTSEDVQRLWAEHAGPTLNVPLGRDAHGTVYVDLVEQGPHTMLAGATGAGKSYLLQALVASLLLHNRPDELNLLLVDFKGGAAFEPFAEFPGADRLEREENARRAGRAFRCPHIVGLILSTGADEASEFDQAAADRVIASLKAEVMRRERILAAYGGEIEEYNRRRPSSQPPLPRLLLIFDEYARVLDADKDFIPQLVNVAGKGRSLGMHLLLATQSMSGKVTQEMKNNIDLRISLRQNEAQDSVEVLESSVAKGIPGRLKGRGYILSKKSESRSPRPFQAGHLGGTPPVAGVPDAEVRIVDWLALGDPRPAPERRHDGATDQDLVIAAIDAASTTTNLPAPFRPLLPPLPATLTLQDLATQATLECPPDAIPFGLADLPAQQAQVMQALRLDGQNRIMIAGGPQSGRTTAIRAIIESAATRFGPDDMHLYVVEREPSGLDVYEGLPHCGGVFGPAHPDRVRRFVTWLADEVQRRSAGRFTSQEIPPTLLVLIDGWEHFFDPTDPMSVETSLVRMLREIIAAGPRLGIHVVVTCGRPALTGKPGDLFDTRLVLPFPQDEVVKSFLPAGVAMPPRLPGRAIVAGAGTQVQLGCPDQPGERLVAACTSPTTARRPPQRFPVLPARCTTTDLPRPVDATPTWIPLGVGGPDVEPLGVDLFDGPQALLISGAAGSGRSTAAATVVRQLADVGVGCVVLCTPRSPLVPSLTGLTQVAVLTGPTVSDDAVRAAADGLRTTKTAVVVDDCEQITVTAVSKGFDERPTLLRDAIKPDNAGKLAVVLCGNGYPMLESRRSLSPEARYAVEEGGRVLIGPTTPAVAREHGFTLEADEYLTAGIGRGHYGRGRSHTPIQLAVAEGRSTPAPRTPPGPIGATRRT